MPIDLTTVGLRIRHARKELRKLTQPKLAAAAGIKQPSLSELETGETKEVSGPVLIALAKALQVRPEWLLWGEMPIEMDDMGALAQDERQLVADYRSSSERWKISLRYMASLRADNEQEEVASGVNVLLAKILGGRPFPVEQMRGEWPRPDASGSSKHELRRVTESTSQPKSGQSGKRKAR